MKEANLTQGGERGPGEQGFGCGKSLTSTQRGSWW